MPKGNEIKDAWGDYVTPGTNPRPWHTLPEEDRVEDILQVLSNKRSFGPQKDAVFKLYFNMMGMNPVKAANALAAGMTEKKIPIFNMYESNFTNLEKYKK